MNFTHPNAMAVNEARYLENDKTITAHEEDGKIFLKYEADIETLLKVNHEHKAMRSRFDRKGEFHHVMRIDQVTLMEVCRRHNLDFYDKDDAKKIMQILRGREFEAFRTYPGAI